VSERSSAANSTQVEKCQNKQTPRKGFLTNASLEKFAIENGH